MKCKCLQLTNIESKQMDSRKINQVFEKGDFDLVSVDAPCSGLGVLKENQI